MKVAFTFLLLSLWVQVNAQTSEYSFAFRIVSLEKKNQKTIATISHGKDLGIAPGARGSVYGIVRKDQPGRNVKLGAAEVLESLAQGATLDMELEKGNEVLLGDLIYLNITTGNAWHSIYFYLTQDAIEVTDAGNSPYVSLGEVLQHDGTALRTEKFLMMQKDLRQEGDRLKKLNDAIRVEAGPNQGKLVSEVLQHTDTLQVWLYLYDLSQNSWDNMGQTIRLADGFYSYVKEGDVASSPVLKDYFVGVSGDKREINFNYYKRKIKPGIVKQWLTDANALFEKKEYAEGISLLEASVFLADKIGEHEQSGINSYRIGEIADFEQKYELSLLWFKKSKQEFEAAHHEEYLGYALQSIAKANYRLKTYDEAKKSYPVVVALRKKFCEADPTNKALWQQLYASLDGAGTLYLDTKEYPQAEEWYRQSLDAATKAEYKDGQAAALWNIALCINNQGNDFEGVVKNYKASQVLYSELEDSTSVAQLYKRIAKAYLKLKQPDKALENYSERLRFLRPSDLDNRADAYWDIGLAIADTKKDFKKSTDYYQQCKGIYMQLHDTVNWVIILNNIGFNYRDLKDSVNSYKNHLAAIALAKASKKKESVADSYDRLSSSYNSFKNKHKRIEYLQLEQQLWDELSDFGKSAEAFEKLGDTYVDLSQFETARTQFMKAAAFYEKAGNTVKQAEMYWDYAYQTGNGLHNYDQSIQNYKIAYGLYIQAGDSADASTMLSNIGQNHWSKLEYEKAIESHRAAIALANQCKNKSQVASSWTKLATLYSESNNPTASVEALTNAVEALTAVNDSTTLAATCVTLATGYGKSKDYGKAFDFFAKALNIRKAMKDSSGIASTYYAMAGVYQSKSDFKESIRYYQDALALQRKRRERSDMIYSLANLGAIEQGVDNNYVTAEKHFLEAQKLAQELNDNYILGYVYGRMKGMYRSQGKKDLAEAYLKKSLEAYRKGKLWKDVAITLVDFGYDASYVSGDTRKAMDYLNQAQAMADTLKDTYLQANIYGAKSGVMREMAEFTTALVYADKGLQLYSKIQNEWGIAGAYIDKGNIFKQLSEYDSAIRCQQAADSIYKKINSEYPRLAPLANLGENFTAQGNYLKGLDYYNQSLAIMQKAHDLNENLAIIQACIGESYLYLNKYSDSEKWLKESLITCDKVGAIRAKADNLGVMGRLKIEEKKYDEALIYLNEGLKLGKDNSLRIAYLNNLVLLGKLETERKNYSRAKPLLEECIQLSRDATKFSTLWEGLYWLGIVYKTNKQLPEAKKYLTESVEVIEKIRNKVSGGDEARKLFSTDKNILNVYESLIDVLLQLGETDLAMSYLQKNNEDNLKAKFKGLDIKFENKDKNLAVAKERTMKAKVDGIEQQLANEKALPAEKRNLEKIKNLEGIRTVAEGDYLKFVNQQVNVRPELTKYFNNSVQPVNFRREKKNIPPDMALLSYLPGETQLYIFVATHDTVIAKVVDIGREQLNRNINAMLNVARSSLGNFSAVDLSTEDAERKELVADLKQTDKMLKPFEEMYHYLIAPASAEIASKKRLGVIPTGVLNYIPFQMLGKTLANGKFSLLINQFAIFYVNSTSILSVPDTQNKVFKIIAFGDPDKTLPSTEKEVDDIKKIFPSASIYLREEATEDKAKFAPDEFNVMHFATHGNLDYEDFTKSFLTMAANPAKKEDGMLTLEELWGMEVMNHLDIVVLSACQTAVTKGSNESSPVSPASGFLQNGVKSVVATLWKVDDEATSLLMNDFYKNIKTMDAVDALRQAQVSLSKNPKFSHPYYWAAEILMGDWR
jgi:CHAT domain-containing protein